MALNCLNRNHQGLDLLKKLLNAIRLYSAFLMDSAKLRVRGMTVGLACLDAMAPKHQVDVPLGGEKTTIYASLEK